MHKVGMPRGGQTQQDEPSMSAVWTARIVIVGLAVIGWGVLVTKAFKATGF